MKKFFSAVLLLTICMCVTSIAFAQSKLSSFYRKSKLQEAGLQAEEKEKPLIYHDPIISPYSNQVIIPVSYSEEDKGMLSSLKTESSYYGVSQKKLFIYYGVENCKFQNLIFFDQVTGKSKVMFDNNVIISAFYYPYEEDKESALPKFLLFGVNKDDTNFDGELDLDDAKVAYISDLDGNNMVQITPDNTKLISWDFDKKTGGIFLRIKHDSNRDRQFDEKDLMSVLRVNAKAPAMGEDIIKEDLLEKLKSVR